MKKRHDAPASVWSEEELLDGKRVRCLTIILSTPGCAWWRGSGGCIMCGYNEKASDRSITGENILSQFEAAWKSFDNQSIVKVYTSGSFIDESEVPSNVREEILNRVKGSGAKMLFESRPEFVKPETMKECFGICPDLEVALGLESANDRILSKSISKGFTFADYEGAAKTVLGAGATVRTYLLLKPPFLPSRRQSTTRFNRSREQLHIPGSSRSTQSMSNAGPDWRSYGRTGHTGPRGSGASLRC